MKKIEQLLFLIDNNKKNEDIKLTMEYDSDNTNMNNKLFLKFGKFLMILYLTNNHLNRNDIKYSNSDIYFKLRNVNNTSSHIKDITAENIIKDMISKSVYNIEFLPKNIERINKEQLYYIKEGFKKSYNECINYKIRWIKYLEKRDECYYVLINNINMLNVNDLNRQLKLLDIRFDSIVEAGNEEANYLYGEIESIESYCKVLDVYIQDAIIGMGDNGMELMWMENDNKVIKPTMLDNIYLGLILSYTYFVSKNKYYYQSLIQTLNPVVTYFNNNEVHDETILLIIFVINKISPYNKLDSIVKKYFNSYNLILNNIYNTENLIKIALKIINEKCINKVANIIL